LNENKDIDMTVGTQQSSYNLPSKFLRFGIENGVLKEMENEWSRENNKDLYEISSEYEFKLGEGILWMLGYDFKSKKNKFEILKASNGKIQLFRKYYIQQGQKLEGYEWFYKLYDKNLSGNELLISIDEEKKVLTLDVKFNSVEGVIESSRVEVNDIYIEESEEIIVEAIDKPHNRIIFGAPGTGKSYEINEFIKECEEELEYKRITFHPGTSYAQFVGSYKPKFDRVLNQITYTFVPGPFLILLVDAINNKSKNHILIIEEINRANVSAVFGDIFQLLDRNSDGESQYEISTSEDIKDYLAHECENFKGDINTLKIPNNMYLWATMNSADQGVMPMDTAFKRRWNFEYMDINKGKEGIKNILINLSPYQPLEWNELREDINNVLTNININEDKLIGPFFLSKAELESEQIDEIFKSKVLMYLFQDVVKHNKSNFFAENIKTYSSLVKGYDDGDNIFVKEIKIKKKEKSEELELVAEMQTSYTNEY
jgi:hypothetical protein